MDDHGPSNERPEHGARPPADAASVWVTRYGAKHRWRRLTDLPAGLQAPARVRLYQRTDHFILQWWDPAAKRNLAERVDGDLLAALCRARLIDERLADRCCPAGTGRRRLGHDELVQYYVTDLHKRAEAGHLSPASVGRYAAALSHYEAFVAQPSVAKVYPQVVNLNRDFRLDFAAYLLARQVRPNGHAHAALRPMKGQAFVNDTVRAMLEWAADPERGHLLPDTFRNPFRRRQEPRTVFRGDPLAAPDITVPMAVFFVGACDAFQLRLFVPLILFGLRAAEPAWLFHEHLDPDWLRVPCIPELSYFTKGRRDKKLPLPESLPRFWDLLRRPAPQGLLYERRAVVAGRAPAPWRQASLADLITEFRRRTACSGAPDSSARLHLRDQLFREAGGLNYDDISHEFQTLARQLRWPPQATLKDFRHAFATMLGNSPLAEAYKKYLMGQSPGPAALHAYTHLNQLREQFQAAVGGAWAELLAAINQRAGEF